MQKAVGTSSQAAKRIETRFRAMERNLGAIGAGLARQLVGPLAALAGAREIGQAADAYTRIQNALKIVGLEGEAAAAVFDRLFTAAQRNAAPVESLVDLYAKVALVQKDLNITSEELERFVSGVAAALRVQGRSAAETSGALLQLTQLLGGARVEAQEFNSILDGAPIIAQTAARGLEEAGGSVAKLRNLVREGRVSSEAFFRAFEAGQASLEAMAESADVTMGQALTQLQNSLIAAVGKIDGLTGASDNVVAALQQTSEAIGEIVTWIDALANSRLGDVIGQFERFASVVSVIPGTVQFFQRQLQALGVVIDATKDAAGIVERIEVPAGRGGGGSAGRRQTARQTVSLEDFAAPTTKTKTSKLTPEDRFARDIDRIRERTEALRLEAQLVGAGIGTRERMLALEDLINEARREGLEITPDRMRAIEAEAAALGDAAEAAARAEDRYAALSELGDVFGHTLIDSLEGLASGTAGLNDVLSDTLDLIRRMVLEAALLGEGPLAGILGGGSRAGGGLFGAIGRLFGGGRASGGPVTPGRLYTVGERGPELFAPSVAGQIVPNGAGGAGMQVTVNAMIDARGADQSIIPRVQEAVKALEARIPTIVNQARQRRMPV